MKFHCADCGQKLEVDAKYSGYGINCPSCSAEISIPKGAPAVSSAEIEEAIRESVGDSAAGVGMTIAKFMANRQMEGGVKLSTEVLEGDQNRKYDYGDFIAQGGMGAILQAADLNVRRTVAMKVLLEPDSASDMDILRFIEEAQVTGQLEHPSVVPVHDLGVDSAGNVFYTMKFVKGHTLHAILTGIINNDREMVAEFPLGRLLTIFQKVCDAIAFAHSKNVIHRDLKPENIMVGEFGEVLVMDWGLAKVLGRNRKDRYASAEAIDSVRNQEMGSAMVTVSGTIFGTPQFMAPEQATGETELMDQKTDIYALGAILYNILTLRAPVDGKTIHEVLEKVTTGDIIPPSSFNTQKDPKRVTQVPGLKAKLRLRHCPNERIPEALAAITMKAMATKRGARYRAVSDLQADIEAFQGGFATSAEQANLFRHAALFFNRHKVVASSALIIAVLGIGFVTKTISSSREIRSVSRQAAPEFIEKARESLAQNKDEEARAAIETALGLDRKSAEAWFEQARLRFDGEDFPGALKALNRAGNLTGEADLQARISALRDFTNEWNDRIEADNRGLLPDHIVEMAPALQPIDPTLAGRFFSRIGDQTEALKIQVGQVMDELLAANPGLEWKGTTDGGDWPFGITGFYWHQIFPETGMDFRPAYFAADPTKLVNITPVTRLPLRALDLNNSGVSDLSELREMSSLRILSMNDTPLLTLEGIEGMKLEKLLAWRTRIEDLGPLRGMPLTHLEITQAPVTDLSPLRGMLLEHINLENMSLESIEPLTGMPLKTVNLHGNQTLRSLEPLRGAPVEVLNIKQVQEVADVSMLAAMPLRSVSFGTPKAPDFSWLSGKRLEWLEVSLELNDLGFLNDCQVASLSVNSPSIENIEDIRSQTGLTTLRIRGGYLAKLSDLSPLSDLPIRSLTLELLPLLTDLSPIANLDLTFITLDLPNAKNLDALNGMSNLAEALIYGGFTDISGLEGLEKLGAIYVNRCTDLTDVRPLMGVPNLHRLSLPESAKDIEFLRGKEHLSTIGYNSHKPVEQFWREYDASR